MRLVVMALLQGALGVVAVCAQTPPEAFGEAVRRSVARSHARFPEAATPTSALSQAILARIEWLNRNNPAFFSNPDWPEKLAAAEAAALGMVGRPESEPLQDQPILAVITKNFSIPGASFRKGQRILLEGLRDNGRRAVTLVGGEPVVLWLDHIKILRTLAPGEPRPVLVRVRSARYGLQGTKGYGVSDAVQAGLISHAAGSAQIPVTDALLSPATALRLNRAAAAQADSLSGPALPLVPPKILTVDYEVNGTRKTRQAREGEILVLD